jgi:CheY-like chemotaxis protein
LKILIIEDDLIFVEGLVALLSDVHRVTVEVHSDVESAQAALRAKMFDLIILDLKLPSTKGALDAKAEHGHAVFDVIMSLAPGTPVRILTSSEPDAFLRRLVGKADQSDVWGGGLKVSTVEYYVKDEATDLIEEIKMHAAVIEQTDRIDINSRGVELGLNQQQCRALRSFVRKSGGASCEARRLGGLSGSVVLKVIVNDEKGRKVAASVAKIGLREKVSKELAAYDRHVRNMKIGAFAHVVAQQEQGLQNSSSVFYQLADGFDRTFFDVVLESPKDAARVIEGIRCALEVWSDAREQRICTVKDVRRTILDDQAYESIISDYGLEGLRWVEEAEVSVASSCLHGDLHGSNVLVDAALTPVVIDYGDVGRGFTCIDPITLELSMIFHPDAVRLRDAMQGGLEHWVDRDEYTSKNAVKPVIDACRNWAYDVAGGDKAFLAAAYCFTLRQLKFNTVDSELTMSLLRLLAARLDSKR